MSTPPQQQVQLAELLAAISLATDLGTGQPMEHALRTCHKQWGSLDRSGCRDRTAIRLTRQLHVRVPEDGEVAGLLALMLLTDARRPARTTPDGELVPLAEQERSSWDSDAIAEGVALITETLATARIGPYQLQAAIAAVHDEARRAEDTDWQQILTLYDLLASISPGPMVTLNRIVAVAMVHGAVAGLEELEAANADPALIGHYRVDAVKAHLLDLSGDHEAARSHYKRAATRTLSLPEQRYLNSRAMRVWSRP